MTLTSNSRLIIITGFAIVLLTLSSTGFIGLYQFSRYHNQDEAATALYLQKRDLVEKMLSASRERAISLTLMLHLADPFEQDEQHLRFNELGTDFAVARQALMSLKLSEPEQAIMRRQGNNVTAGIDSQHEVIDLIFSGATAKAGKLLTNQAIPAQKGNFAILQQLADTQQQLYESEVHTLAENFHNNNQRFTIVLSILSAFVSIIVTYLVLRSISHTEKALFAANERFDLAMQGANDGLWDWNIKTGEVYYSPRWKAMLGYADDEIEHSLETWESRVQPDDREKAEADIAAHLAGKTPLYENIHRIMHRDGSYRWHWERGIAVRDESGQPCKMVGTNTDITEQMAIKDALFEEKERALVTLHSIGEAVITTDDIGQVTSINPVAESLIGISNDELRGCMLSNVFQLASEQRRSPLENPVYQSLRSGQVTELPEHTLLLNKDGKEICIAGSAAPIQTRSGELIGTVMVFRDMSDRREMAMRLTWQATHDALTGLINRSELERRLSQLIDNARLEPLQHSFLYLDLDQFKLVNDISGHTAGDELLRQLSFLLQQQLRDTDTLARLGGDEFGILLHGCHLEQAKKIAAKIRDSVKAFRFVWQDKTFDIGVSIGIALIDQNCEGITSIMSEADVACYAAKDLGRNRYHVYSPDDATLARRHSEMQWATQIKQALEEGRIILYQQAIQATRYAEASGQHIEILIRMLDSDNKLVPPSTFIPAAERYGLMADIDFWVIEQTLRYLHQHPETGLVSINLSGNTFSDAKLLPGIKKLLHTHQVNPARVCFEITETAAIANLTDATHFISELKAIGCSFALDDFGSGLSSFAYLKNLAVDYLKIDGCFVKDMLDNPIDCAMVESIHKIGETIGIKTIAEYVENDAIRERLEVIGVDYVQGYSIAKPRPLSENVLPLKLTARG